MTSADAECALCSHERHNQGDHDQRFRVWVFGCLGLRIQGTVLATPHALYQAGFVGSAPSKPVAVHLQNRLAPLMEAPRPSRRLVLVGGVRGGEESANDDHPTVYSDHRVEMGESDTESVDWSVAGVDEAVPDTVEERAVDVEIPRNAVLRMVLSTLDDVDPLMVFRQRAAVMRSVPCFLREPFRNAMKLALGGHVGELSCRRSEAGEGEETLRVTAKDVVSQASCRRIDPKGEIGGAVPNFCQGRVVVASERQRHL